ncbi:MAG: TIGR04282 family arsenosugar biosynthesis glycosyltransferase [bacterium]
MSDIIQGGEGPALKGCVALLCFMEQPGPGSLKSPLAARIGEEAAVRLYRAFLESTVRTALRTRPVLTPVGVGTPDDALTILREIAGPRLPLWPQGEGDLGQRMARASARAFSGGAEKVLVIGTDAPDLPLGHLLGAARRLDREDVVLGPGRDGGYYLFGLSRPVPGLFRGVEWSSDRVLQQTVRRVRAAGLRSSYLPVRSEVDGPQDLLDLRDRLHRAAGTSAGQTVGMEDLRSAVDRAAALMETPPP